jgi:hypothetical protein
MRSSTCQLRDGYLGKWLTSKERVDFEGHLAHCPDCQPIVQEQRQLDDLLARANVAIVPVPAGLIDEIDRRLRRARRRRMAAWAPGLAAAGILICSLAAWLAQQADKERRADRPVVTHKDRQAVPARDPRSLVKVSFQPSSDVIAVPQKTENPSVTIIWVYPTIKTVQEPTLAPADLFPPVERNGI